MDDAYQQRTIHRATLLEQKEVGVRHQTAATHKHLARVLADLELEMETLKVELGLLDQETIAAAARIKFVLSQFKTVVRQGDFVRLQQRIDLWKPEQRITRGQFRKLLK